MKRFFYYLSLPFLYVLSLLPWRVMYWCSDALYLLAYHVLGYRRKVILNNLRNSFPEKTEDEIQALAKTFAAYTCDLMLETIKTLTISERALKKHVALSDISVLQRYFEHNQSVILVMGHFGNWELAGARFSASDLHALYVIYHPLSNPYFDRLFYKMRTRLGTGLYTMKGAVRGILRDRDKVTATAFIADQSPPPGTAYWTTFLHQDTAVFTGTEKIARKLNYPVVYISVRRPKRGYYTVSAELLVDHPATTEEGVVSELHTRRLEQDIREQPEIWLWSHRRWKHQRPKEH